MFKPIAKTAGTTWDDIARRVYGTPERAGDIEKLNNNISTGEILVPQADDDAESGETGLRLEYGEKAYKNFSEYLLIDRLGAVKGAVLIFVVTDEKYPFKIKDPVKLYSEDGLFLKGRIANIYPRRNKNARWIQVEIKSDAGILLESELPYPLEFMNLSRKQILTNIAGYYGINIEFSDAPELDEIIATETGTSFTADINEKAFNFMFRLCQSAGLLLHDTGSGLFVGRLDSGTKEKINFIDGACVGISEIYSEFKTDGLARYYEVNSQYPATDSATVQIPFPYPITKRFNSNDFNAASLSAAASLIACKEIGEAFKVYITLNENKAVKSGDFAVVKNEDIFIEEEREFVIEQVIRKVDTTSLILTLPCAYTGEIPEQLPLC